MPTFSLEERDLAWVDRAPVVIDTDLRPWRAPPPRSSTAWPIWRPGPSGAGHEEVRIDGPASGVGALRTVWVRRHPGPGALRGLGCPENASRSP